MKILAFLILTTYFFSNYAKSEISIIFPTGNLQHQETISSNKFDKNQYGHFEIYKTESGNSVFKVSFSNGSMRASKFGSLIACVHNGKVIDFFNLSRNLGWSAHRSVERTVFLDLSACPKDSFPAIQWNNSISQFLSENELNELINGIENFEVHSKSIKKIY